MKKIIILLIQIIILLFIISSTTFTQSWTQVGSDLDGEAAGDQSGSSVSLSADGKRVAIGAIYNDGTGPTAGHVRIYSESGGVWTQLGSDIDGEAAGDRSGSSVSLSADGKRVAIGAWGNDGTGNWAGHVRIYSESGGVWTQLGSDIDGEAADDWSGYSISLSADGKRVAIGAFRNDGNGSMSGHVRVYNYNGGAWAQLGDDIDGEAAGDRSGISVSLSADGKRVAIGAHINVGTGPIAGHVRIYSESGGVWTQLGSDIDGEDADYSGRSVSLSADGKRVAIGAYLNDGTGPDAGHVRIYSESGGVWTQLGSDIDGEAAQDQSGWSVSLSSDGSRVAIGAIYNDGTGEWAGHVRIYSESGGVWTQLGSDIDGEAAGDYSGHSVSLSADGERVAIGAVRNDGTGPFSGHVRIYDTPMLLKLQQEVQILINIGALTHGQGNSLIDKLESSIRHLNKGRAKTAINVLRDFIKKVNNYTKNGTLSSEEGLPLIEAANAIINQLQGGLPKQGITNDTLEEQALPKAYTLEQNFPNPFNPITTINYNLPQTTKVTVTVFDMMGREVRILVNSVEQAGYKTVIWDSMDSYGQPVSGGIYILNIQAGKFSQTKKMVLLR